MKFVRHILPILVFAALGLMGCEHVGAFEPFREVSCFEAAKISLKDAIAAAEAEGGRVLDADYRQDTEMGCLQGDPGIYDITLLRAGRIGVVSVDARSGRVGPHQEADVLNELFGTQRFEGSPADMVRVLPKLSKKSGEVIDLAERQGGKAMVAWIEERNGKPGYVVKLVDHGKVRVTWMDGG